jgi:hypothetical protein
VVAAAEEARVIIARSFAMAKETRPCGKRLPRFSGPRRCDQQFLNAQVNLDSRRPLKSRSVISKECWALTTVPLERFMESAYQRSGMHPTDREDAAT